MDLSMNETKIGSVYSGILNFKSNEYEETAIANVAHNLFYFKLTIGHCRPFSIFYKHFPIKIVIYIEGL